MEEDRMLSLKWNDHNQTFFDMLSTVRRKESFSDVTLVSDGRFYPAHKLVLAMCSDFFSDMFSRIDCKKPMVILGNISQKDLEALLDYMYLGEVNVLQSDLENLMQTAKTLKIKGLAESPNKGVSTPTGGRRAGLKRRRQKQLSGPPVKRFFLVVPDRPEGSRKSARSSANADQKSIWSPARGTASETEQEDKQEDKPTTVKAGKSGKSSKTLGKYVCPYCGVKLNSRSSLYMHKKSKHPEEKKEEPTTRASVQCPKCEGFTCGTLRELITHLNSTHETDFQIKEAQFKSKEDFEEWKSDTEKTKGTWFVKKKGDSDYQYHVTSYYVCNRSGNFKTAGTGKRALKKQGSSKINGSCCAFIRQNTDKASGEVNVEYCVDHTHETEAAHLKMSDDLRAFIVGELVSGVDSKVLLEKIRSQSKLEGRDSLLKHRDIINIKNQYNIPTPVKEKPDTPQKKKKQDTPPKEQEDMPQERQEDMNDNPQLRDYNPAMMHKEQGMEGFAQSKGFPPRNPNDYGTPPMMHKEQGIEGFGWGKGFPPRNPNEFIPAMIHKEQGIEGFGLNKGYPPPRNPNDYGHPQGVENFALRGGFPPRNPNEYNPAMMHKEQGFDGYGLNKGYPPRNPNDYTPTMMHKDPGVENFGLNKGYPPRNPN